MLFNIDCNCLFMSVFPPLAEGVRYSARILHDYIDLLADNGIDTVLMNANGQVPWNPTRRTPHVLTGYSRGDREFCRGHFPPCDATFTPGMLDAALDRTVRLLDRFLDLQEAGVDWLAEIAAACRRRGIAPWLSIRMNDAHGANSWERSFMNCAPQRDARYRLSGRRDNPRDGVDSYRQLLNYECPEVREYMFGMIREFVEDYDYEGLELDWLRAPFCCEPPAAQESVDTMTEWFAAVRELTRRQARLRGHTYPVSLRIPAQFGMLRAIGIDVPALAAAGLIDSIAPSNFWQSTWDISADAVRRELGGHVRVYGVIEDAPNWVPAKSSTGAPAGYRLLSTSPELLRGCAAGKLANGADGIECYNFFCSDESAGASGRNPDPSRRQGRYEALADLADLAVLRGKPKHYALANMYGPWDFPLFETADQLPRLLEPGLKQLFRVCTCSEPSGCTLTVQVVYDRQEAPPCLGVSVNGCYPGWDGRVANALLFPAGIRTEHIDTHEAQDFRFPAGVLTDGICEVTVFHGGVAGGEARAPEAAHVRIVSIELGVK